MRMLSKIAISSLSLVTAFSASAAMAETEQFDHEGFHYSYTVTEKGETKVISGVRGPGNVPFHLTVRNGRVKGVSGGVPVSFNIEDARGATAGDKIALR